jgi:hypothetical protein
VGFWVVQDARVVFAGNACQRESNAVAVVGSVIEAEAAASSMVIAIVSSLADADDIVALADGSDGFGNIVQLVSQRIFDDSKPDGRRTEGQGEDQHEFGGNYKARFVIDECAQHNCVS